MTKMNVSPASAQMKYWHDFSANVECCHSFMAKMNVGMASVQILVQLQCEFSANVECCHDVSAKMDVDTASVQMMVRLHNRCKCKYCFMAKMKC